MLTQADLALRMKFIGASEAGAILGLDRYRTPYDVWALKTGRCEDGGGNEATDLGHRLEPVVLDWAAEQLGTLQRNIRKIDESLYLGATYDALTEHTEPVEAKTSGLLSPLSSDWGEPGTDQVPERIIIQAHVQMLLVNAEVCYVPALLGLRGLQMFVIERCHDLTDTIRSFVPTWWATHVIGDTPPEGTPSLPILKRFKREPDKIVDVSPDLIARYEAAKVAAHDTEEWKDDLQRQVLAAMGDGEVADFGDPSKWYTYRASTVNRFKETVFREAHPQLFKQFTHQTIQRSLRLVSKPKTPKRLTGGQ